MTICLAAFSHADRSIVSVSDRMVTIGDRSADDTTIKSSYIHGDWRVQFADDAGIASLVMQRAVPLLHPYQNHSAVSVATMMEQAVHEQKASQLQAVYGISRDELQAMSPAKRKALIKKTEIPCEFLVSGFDADGLPHVMPVGSDGVARDCDAFGYWAIGSGQDIALATLGRRSQSFRLDVVSTIYNLLEARFDTEADPNVGKGETLLIVWRHDEPPVMFDGQTIRAIRMLWNVQRTHPPFPATSMIRDALASATVKQSGSTLRVTEFQSTLTPPTRDPKDQPPSPG